MQEGRFKALVLDQQAGQVSASIRELPWDALPPGDVLVRVAYSSLNYKDGLAVTGQGKVVRSFPMVPGIDLAGTVEESTAPDYTPGDRVILTGWGLGESHWGGFEQVDRVQAAWLVPLPDALSLEEAMGIGTAGFTAMLAVMALERAGLKQGGEVVVTGATGGVGSMAVALLAHLGYRVAASTGRPALHDYLRGLGATEILERGAFTTPSDRPLERGRWDGAVDTVGGETLSGLLRVMGERSSVAACGNAGGAQLTTTVFPFILRGVNLLGIESVRVPREERKAAWERLARQLPRPALNAAMERITLEQVPEYSEKIVQGQIRGRIVVDPNA